MELVSHSLAKRTPPHCQYTGAIEVCPRYIFNESRRFDALRLALPRLDYRATRYLEVVKELLIIKCCNSSTFPWVISPDYLEWSESARVPFLERKGVTVHSRRYRYVPRLIDHMEIPVRF